MTVLTGLDFYAEFDGVALKSDYRTFEDGIELETVDGSSGGSTVRKEVATLFKVAPKLKIVVDNDATGLAIQAVLVEGHSGTLVWGRKGNTAGLPKWGISATVKKSTISNTYDKEKELEVEFYNTADDFVYDGRTATF